MKHTPRPAQEEAIRLALSQIGASNGFLLGDEGGAGKTTVASEVILRAGWGVTGQVLIIALPNTHSQWVERLALQSDGTIEARVCNGSTVKGKASFEAFQHGEPAVYVAGADYLRQKDFEMQPAFDGNGQPKMVTDKKTGLQVQARRSVRLNAYRRTYRKPLEAVIFDETHQISNRKSKTRKTIYSIKSGYRLAMSGTWMRNDPANMWSIATYVWPGDDPATGLPYVDEGEEGGYWGWAKRYLELETVYGASGRAVQDARGEPVKKVLGEKVPGEFVATLPAYRRLENEDRVPDPLIFEVDPTPEQAAQLADLEADFLTWVRNWDGDHEPLVADIPIVLMTRMRQVAVAALSFGQDGEVAFAPDAASAKLAPLRYLVEERWKGQPVAIYTSSKIGAKFIEARMRAAGVDARAWTGDLSKTARQELKEAFIAGEFPYFIATVQSVGVGVDGLQKVCNKVVWIDKPVGDPTVAEQAIWRFFRPGRTEAHGGFEHVELRMRNSLDEQTAKALLAKALAVSGAINDTKYSTKEEQNS